MAKEFYVYSTLTCDQNYTNYAQGGADLPIPHPSVLIAGGANVANDRLVTPYGAVTKVTEEQMDYLLDCRHFIEHEKAGFVSYSEHEKNPDKVAADMTSRSKDAPLVENDFDIESEDESQPKPVVGAVKRGRPSKQ